MMEPDMIFSWGSLFSEKNLGNQPEWITNGTNTYISTNTRHGGHDRTLENEYTDLLNIGKIFNVEDKAQAIVDEIKNEIAGVLEQTAGQETPRVAVIEFPEASSIGKEDLLGLNPDVIFVVYMARTEGVEEEMRSKVVDDPAFAELSAVKNSRVCTIMLGDMYASAVRSSDGIRTFAAGMYPELYQ